MDKKELTIWVYLNEIDYCLQDDTLNKNRALGLVDIMRDILTEKIEADFENCDK